MIIEIYVIACLAIEPKRVGCDKIQITSNQEVQADGSPVTMGACMNKDGQASAQKWWEEHKNTTMKGMVFGGWACTIANQPKPKGGNA